MDSVGAFVGLAAGMWGGAVLSGLIPMVIPKSPRTLTVFNVLGAGLLFGVAVGVIVPEGIIFIYDSTLPGHSESKDEHEHDHEKDIIIHNINDIGKETFHTVDDNASVYLANHKTIGITLIAGFFLMLVINEIIKSFAPARNAKCHAESSAQS
jgi:hypothetical protein